MSFWVVRNLQCRVSALLFFEAILFTCLLTGCASTAPLTEEIMEREREVLNKFLAEFRVAVRDKNADKVYHSLSRNSKEWIHEVRRAAESEPLRFLENRPFFEVLSVLALRVQERRDPSLDADPVSLIRRLLLDIRMVSASFTKFPVGEFHVRELRRAELGLQKAPNVPVFFFVKEDDHWKINIVRTLPLILAGAESIARQKHSTIIEQAVFIIEMGFNTKITLEDIER